MKPRIALFLPGYELYGVLRVTLTLGEQLLAKGYPCDLLIGHTDRAMPFPAPPGLRVVELGSGAGNSAVGPLEGYLRQGAPAAMLSATHPANMAALVARQHTGAAMRLVVSIRTVLSVFLRDSPARLARTVAAVGQAYGQADGVVAVSEAAAVDLHQLTGFPRDRITAIHNPVNLAALARQAGEPLQHPWFQPGAPPVILAAGRLAPEKDFPTLLRAFAKVRAERAARLLILGEGQQRERILALARDLGIEGDVSLPGFVPNPFAFMARAAVFVLSSQTEGCGNVLIEAMACGTPVVSTDCPGGPPELLRNGEYGPLVTVGDDGGMAQAILGQLDSPTNAAVLRRRAEGFDAEVVTHAYLELLLPGES